MGSGHGPERADRGGWWGLQQLVPCLQFMEDKLQLRRGELQSAHGVRFTRVDRPLVSEGGCYGSHESLSMSPVESLLCAGALSVKAQAICL